MTNSSGRGHKGKDLEQEGRIPSDQSLELVLGLKGTAWLYQPHRKLCVTSTQMGRPNITLDRILNG